MPSVLDPEWVGRRVVIRRVLDDAGSTRARFADAVGDLLELRAGEALLDTRRGRLRVPLARVAAARLVEPSNADVLALQRICAHGWRPAETADLDGWTLQANDGFTGRANSVLPAGQLQRPLDEALARVRAWYAARKLPARIQVPFPARRRLDAELAARGWATDIDTHVFASRLDRLTSSAAELDVQLASAPDDAWLGRYRDGTVPVAARDLLVRHDCAAFAAIRRDGHTVAIGRGAVDDGWLGLTAVEVEPGRRRQGLATAVMAALCRWGGEQGATHSYLQVASGNAGAVALYRHLGYWRHHDYRYRVAPDA